MKAAGISYLQNGTGQPVIYLHGIGGGAASFQHQLAAAGNTCTITAWDMPGYRESDPIDDPITFPALSDRLGDFITALGYDRAHLVGHSIGGMVALEHALRRPQQVATLTMIGSTPAFGGRDESFKEAFLKARLEPLKRGMSMPEMAKAAAPHLVGPNAKPAVIDEIAGIMAEVSEPTWRAILDCLVTFNRRADLTRVSQPCLFIAGEHDQNAPARTMQRMADGVDNAEYHVIRDTGHMINQEAPKRVNAILRSFFRRHRL